MGQLIKRLRERTTLPQLSDDVITEALKKRNFLNHHFFREHAEDFVSMNGKRLMIAELTQIQGVLQKAQEMSQMLCLALSKALGYTPEMIQADFEEMMREARGE